MLWVTIKLKITYKMNTITYRLGRNPIPSDSETETDSSDSETETDSETDSEAERIAEQYPYNDSEDED